MLLLNRGLNYGKCALLAQRLRGFSYQCFSAFAGNPYFIDWNQLVESGYLEKEDLSVLESLPKDKVDYGALFAVFWPIVDKAFIGFKEALYQSNELKMVV